MYNVLILVLSFKMKCDMFKSINKGDNQFRYFDFLCLRNLERKKDLILSSLSAKYDQLVEICQFVLSDQDITRW